jgi:hypothetical protein
MLTMCAMQNVKENKEEHEKLAKDIESLAAILRPEPACKDDPEYAKVAGDMDR